MVGAVDAEVQFRSCCGSQPSQSTSAVRCSGSFGSLSHACLSRGCTLATLSWTLLPAGDWRTQATQDADCAHEAYSRSYYSAWLQRIAPRKISERTRKRQTMYKPSSVSLIPPRSSCRERCLTTVSKPEVHSCRHSYEAIGAIAEAEIQRSPDLTSRIGLVDRLRLMHPTSSVGETPSSRQIGCQDHQSDSISVQLQKAPRKAAYDLLMPLRGTLSSYSILRKTLWS
jgi:hypothetical protein